eukprot:scaffold4516_cov417-Prasinococcus_capsulatus_cf.AAC.15
METEGWNPQAVKEHLASQEVFWVKAFPSTVSSTGVRIGLLPCTHYLSSPLSGSATNTNGLCRTTPLAAVVDMSGRIECDATNAYTQPYMELLHSALHERGRLAFLELLDSLYDLSPDEVVEKLGRQLSREEQA